MVAMQDSQPTYTKDEVLEVLRILVANQNLAGVGASLGVTGQYIGKVLSGDRRLSAKLADKLDFIRLPETYVRKEKKGRDHGKRNHRS